MKEGRILVLIRTALAAGGLLLLAPPWKDWLREIQVPLPMSESIEGLLRGVGEAFIVALVLELLVDTPLKRRLVEATIRDVAQRILAHLLPPHIFRYIEEQLLRANLVRKNWNITYRISLVEDREEYVKFETESKYEIANVAPSPVNYSAVYEVELPLFPEFGPTEITEVTVRNLLLPAGDNLLYRYPDGADTPDAPRVIGDYLRFKKSFTIPVHKEDPKHKYSALQFVFRSTEHFHVGSIVPFFAKYVTETTTLRVTYPKDRLRAIVDFPAHEESELQPEGGTKGDDFYKFPKPILPGQGFTVRFPRATHDANVKQEGV